MIRVTNLTKRYGTRVAVDRISFDIAKGEIVGFLGPNGSGKTTTMRMLAGYLSPTCGELQVAGRDMLANAMEARRRIGYMPEVAPLYLDMTVISYLQFVARLRGVERKKTKSRAEEAAALCRLEDQLHVILGRLSKGFRQRVGLAQAIVHDPEVLILDEPTVGIDPIQVAQTRELIKELGKRRTILLSTHILPEVSMICQRVIVIQKGRIIAEDRIENLSRAIRGNARIRLLVQGPAEEVTSGLRNVAGIRSVRYEKPYHVVEFRPADQPHAELADAIRKGCWTLQAMETPDASLEDVFFQLTAGKETIR